MVVFSRLFSFAGTLFLIEQLEILFAQHKAVAEVFLTNDLVFGQLLWCALKEDAPLEEQIGTVGAGKGFLHVVVGDEDADVAVFLLVHSVLDGCHRGGIDAGKWFVEHDVFGVVGQTAGYLCASALIA